MISEDALLSRICGVLEDKKAEDVVCLAAPPGKAISHMVIASGQSARQVGAMAQALEDDLKKEGCSSVAVEGLPQADWVVVDTGPVVVHLFRPPVRQYYHLEDLWNKVPDCAEAPAPSGA
jgi:ribosome-associated protein